MIFLCTSVSVNGQTTCSTATQITPTTACDSATYHFTTTEYWLRFTATAAHIRIGLAIPNNTPQANITNIYLYRGSCSKLTLIAQNNSEMIIDADMNIDSTYYIKVVQGQSISSYFGLRAFYFTPTYSIGYTFPGGGMSYWICCGQGVTITNITSPAPTSGDYCLWLAYGSSYHWIMDISASSFGTNGTCYIPPSVLPCNWFNNGPLELYLSYPCSSTPLCGDYCHHPLTVYNPNISISANPVPPICPGQSTTLTASGGVSYVWNTGPTTTSIIVSPTSTTTYTVTGTDSHGCTDDASYIVTVNPAPNVPVIVGDTVSCGTTVYSVQTPQSGVTYCWSGPSGTIFNPTCGTSTTVTWPSGFVAGNITVTATNSYNCTSVGTKYIYECCFNHSGTYRDFTNTNASAIISAFGMGSTITTNDIININGVLTINTNLAFNNCPNIYLGRDAEIVINSNTTLTLSNLTHLQAACEYMWDGIIANSNTAILAITGYSDYIPIIEDANYAVVSISGGLFYISNAILRNNFRHIIVQPYSSSYGSYIKQSTLTCTRDLYSPYQYERTYAGITINELATTWSVGDASASIYKNFFNNMWYGIKSSKTNNFTSQNISIVNNQFTNINTTYTSTVDPFHSTVDPNAGICIHYLSNPTSGSLSYLTVGGTGSYSGNTFGTSSYGCTKGIEVYRKTNTTIRGNTFTNLAKGIYVNNVWRSPVSILYNTFDNITGSGSFAISTLYTRSALSITYNNINATTANKVTTGISVSDNSDASSYTESTVVTYNTIRNAYTGIFGTVPSGYSQPVFNASNNSVTMPSSLTTYNYGIRIESCPAALIADNTVSWGTTPNSGNVNQLQGIRLMNSTGSYIHGNTLTKMGSGIRCSGTENPTYISCNIMNTCYYGTYLETAGIGNQGQTNEPWDNQWVNNVNAYRVYGTLGTSQSVNWYYKTGTNYTLSSGQYYVTGGNGFSTFLTNNADFCVEGGALAMGSETFATSSQRQDYLGIDNLNLVSTDVSSYTDESEYFIKKNAFRLIKKDTSILDLGFADDQLYKKFYNKVKSSNIGKLDKVADLISKENYQAASAINAAIDPLNVIEENSKSVNSIFLNTWATGQFGLSSADSTMLRIIAEQNPLYAGDGVYLARVMLQYYPDNITALSNQKVTNPASTSNSSNITVYPNPAYENITVLLGNTSEEKYLFELYDAIGNIVFSKEFAANEYSVNIPLDNISKGIYVCKVSNSANINLYNDKLVIIK